MISSIWPSWSFHLECRLLIEDFHPEANELNFALPSVFFWFVSSARFTVIIQSLLYWVIWQSFDFVIPSNTNVRLNSHYFSNCDFYFSHLRKLSFVFTFCYLAFFRLCHTIGLPKPNPHSNAVQLLLTLRV